MKRIYLRDLFAKEAISRTTFENAAEIFVDLGVLGRDEGNTRSPQLTLTLMYFVRWRTRLRRISGARPDEVAISYPRCFDCVARSGLHVRPFPLQPLRTGSIGVPHRGVLVNGEEVLPSEALTFLRNDDRHFSSAELRRMLVQASNRTFSAHGVPMVLGDLRSHRGQTHAHFRTARAAMSTFFFPTKRWTASPSPPQGFIRLAPTESGLMNGAKYLFDWTSDAFGPSRAIAAHRFGRSCAMDFSNRRVNILLLDWARALREPADLVERASLCTF